jgi:ribosomal protein L11 methyltransferase
MIAAGKLGNSRLAGLDKDFSAVAVARNNLLQNRIDPGRFLLFAGNLASGVIGSFDMVTANILTEVIVSFLPQIPGILIPGGIFICSGMIDKNTHRVEKKLIEMGFEILEKPQKEGWVSFAAQYHGNPDR